MTSMQIDSWETETTTVSPMTQRTHEDDAQSSSDSDASASATDQPAASEDTRCKYPSKYCGRARVRKTNGTSHRFCEYHRVKANTNQKRWTSVRRQQAAHDEQQRQRVEAFALVNQFTSMDNGGYVHGHSMSELLPDPVHPSAEPVELPVEDVQILKALFVGELEEPHERETTYPSHRPPQLQIHAFDCCDIAL